jgi:hypothetical protein
MTVDTLRPFRGGVSAVKSTITGHWTIIPAFPVLASVEQ